MADYFVSATRGNDTTGAGTATNPWKTIDKAIGAGKAVGATLSAPTNLHIEPGLYREAVNLQVTPSAVNPLLIRGDHDGSAFAAGGYATPKTGVVDWRAWSDDATPLSNDALKLDGKPGVTLARLKITAGNAGAIFATESDQLLIRDCSFRGWGGNYALSVNQVYTKVDAVIERCAITWMRYVAGVRCVFAGAAGVGTPVGSVKMLACLFDGGYYGVQVGKAVGGSEAVKTAVEITGCTIRGSKCLRNLMFGDDTNNPTLVRGCVLIGTEACFDNSDATRIDEDYNALLAPTLRTNMNAGANSIQLSGGWWRGGDELAGDGSRPYYEPSLGSPLLGLAQAAWMPESDLLGRPYADPPSAGCLERVDPAEPEPPAADLPKCIGF